MSEENRYKINKGINQSIEFKGLKAQYIWYLGAGVVGLLIVFSILYFLGLPSIAIVITILTAGIALVMKVYQLSGKYGEHGLMKAIAKKRIPSNLRIYSRSVYYFSKTEA